MKRCGNCTAFVKIRNREGLPGICDKHDWTCDENYGRKCQDHKSIKYKRISLRHP